MLCVQEGDHDHTMAEQQRGLELPGPLMSLVSVHTHIMYIRVCICTCVYTRMCVYVRVYTHVVCIRMCVYTRRVYTYVCICTCVYHLLFQRLCVRVYKKHALGIRVGRNHKQVFAAGILVF
jgi:hypothetical protein